MQRIGHHLFANFLCSWLETRSADSSLYWGIHTFMRLHVSAILYGFFFSLHLNHNTVAHISFCVISAENCIKIICISVLIAAHWRSVSANVNFWCKNATLYCLKIQTKNYAIYLYAFFMTRYRRSISLNNNLTFDFIRHFRFCFVNLRLRSGCAWRERHQKLYAFYFDSFNCG